MSAVVAPLYTAERAGRRLRAFAAEGPTPELPWFALADLAAALATTRAEEVELLANLGAGALGLRLREVVTADGPVVLVDEPSAFRLLASAEATRGRPPTVPKAMALFRDAEVGGGMAIVRGLPQAEAERWIREAWEASAAALRADLARQAEAGRGAGRG